jgi:hypothetical protein
MNPVIEAMAKAIFAQEWPSADQHPDGWGSAEQPARDRCYRLARASLDAGLAVLRDPTQEMIRAGERIDCEGDFEPNRYITEPPRHRSRRRQS